ncbi:hypothetical protein AC578_6899 [Pseudocercospora eumusae]|uniref:Uncharacterized protein n=1 Tax=Pseudocercospora eumusae TaxID=321146 RepID=A0A139H9V7_9PEZI|nr:hypothetical protein AC578_6899 [Pseudocercospora eumusae]
MHNESKNLGLCQASMASVAFAVPAEDGLLLEREAIEDNFGASLVRNSSPRNRPNTVMQCS